MKLKILSDTLFSNYILSLKNDLSTDFAEVESIDLTPSTFTFYTSVAVISSSRIEGEQMDIDSYLKHKMQDIEFKPQNTQKPDDLFNAYLFARKNELNESNFIQSHALITQHLLPAEWQGVYRKKQMLVMNPESGRIQYEAAPFSVVENEMSFLWEDIKLLKNSGLTIDQVFYYASFIHLVFVNIHPFNDGNGRAARLLEKWFLAECLGEKAWCVKSEKYYYDHVDEYYQNLNRLGIFYEKLDYGNSLPFLQMLPFSLFNKI